MSRRPVVPALAFVIVLGLALLLIAGIIVRPWEFAAGGSQVNMLAAQSPSGYDRSPLSFVGSTKEVGWAPMYDTDLSGNSGRAYYVQYGCGSCHGLDGKGSSYAPLRVASAEQVLMMVRVGPGGMPVYPKGYLPDEAVKAIAAWLIAQQPSVKPQPTPTPSPSPTPSPVTTPTPGTTPIPTSTPSPTPTLTTTQPTADSAHGGAVFSSLGCSSCHGQGGKGTAFAPALNSAQFAQRFPTDSSIGDIMRKGIGMMPGYDSSKLSDADLADLIAYLRSLQ